MILICEHSCYTLPINSEAPTRPASQTVGAPAINLFACGFSLPAFVRSVKPQAQHERSKHMDDIHWYWANPLKVRQEIDRTTAEYILENFLPEHEQWYEKLARDGIIPVEMLEALFDTERDPLDRRATMDRIFGMVDEYADREQEKQTVLGRLQKLQSDVEQLKTQTVSPTRKAETKSNRGMKAGTPERVAEFHRLVKSGMSHREAKRQAHCDPNTYYRWCLQVTGEEPTLPYR